MNCEEQPVVFVVDDEPSVREALASLLASLGLAAETFASAREFLDHPRADARARLVLDVRLSQSSGLDLQRELDMAGIDVPIVFITGHGDVPMAVRAMEAGAIEFLTKPFDASSCSAPFAKASSATASGAHGAADATSCVRAAAR